MKYQIVVVHGNLAFINSYRLDFLITIQLPRVTMMAAYYNMEVVHSYARHPIMKYHFNNSRCACITYRVLACSGDVELTGKRLVDVEGAHGAL